MPLNTFPILWPATTTTNINAQATSSVAAQVNPSNSQPQSQTQHLANLLYQVALQLTPSCPTLSQPQIVSPAMPDNAHVSVSETPHRPNDSLYPPHSSQQEDQLSEASAPTPSNQPPGTLLSANNNPVMLDTVSAAASSSMLPPIPFRLRDCIVSSEFIDLNSLLTRAMFLTRDGPTQFQSSPPLFTFQMSAQKIVAFRFLKHPLLLEKLIHLLYGWKHGMFTHPSYCQPIQHVRRNCWAIS